MKMCPLTSEKVCINMQLSILSRLTLRKKESSDVSTFAYTRLYFFDTYKQCTDCVFVRLCQVTLFYSLSFLSLFLTFNCKLQFYIFFFSNFPFLKRPTVVVKQ